MLKHLALAGACWFFATALPAATPQPPRSSLPALDAYGLARQCLRSGQFSQALQALDSAIQFDPQFAAAYLTRATVRVALGDHYKALADLSVAIALEPGSAEAYTTRGMVYARLGQEEQAMSDLDQAIELNPGQALAHYQRGQLLAKRGLLPESQEELKKAAELDPGLTVLGGVGIVLKATAASDASETDPPADSEENIPGIDLPESGDETPSEPSDTSEGSKDHGPKLKPRAAEGPARQHEPLKLPARPANERGTPAKADRPTLPAASRSPAKQADELEASTMNAEPPGPGLMAPRRSTVDGSYRQGCALVAQRDYAAALEQFSQAIELNPTFAPAYAHRGRILLGLHRYQEAVNDYSALLQLNPAAVYAYIDRGQALLRLGQADAAIADFSAAIRLDPDRGSAYLSRAQAYDMRGDRRRARADRLYAKDLPPPKQAQPSGDAAKSNATTRAAPSQPRAKATLRPVSLQQPAG